MENKIGIFDSGIGGLTILEEIKKILPNENIIYYQDTKNNPYGPKSEGELKKITKHIINYLEKEKCNIIVVACNTATTMCINYLRKEFPNLIIIGTEPAIKLACDYNSKNILVLGTHGTINSKNVQKLIKNNQKVNQEIYLQECEGLAHSIEINDKNKITYLLNKYLLPYQNKNIDAIVLGCTHYPYIKDEILSYFPSAIIYDSAPGVARELSRKITQKREAKGSFKIIDTLKDDV